MADIHHSSGLLVGDPTFDAEAEEKTAAQLNDERQTSIMAKAKSAYDEEMDETPSIEKTTEHEGLMMGSAISKPKLKVDAAFAEEMHEREAKERIEREKKRQEAEAKAKKEAERHEKELQIKLAEAQELDSETIEQELKDQNYENNQEKLYPDAKPVASELEERLRERRTDKGYVMAGRAKLGDIEDSNLRNAIYISIVSGAVGAALIIIGQLIGKDSNILQWGFTILGAIANIFAFIYVAIQANKAKHREVPSTQAGLFYLATAIPGVLFRLPVVLACSTLPIVGKILGPFMGTAIIASFHYSFINKYSVAVSAKNTIINTAIFTVIYLACFNFTDINYAPTAFLNSAIAIVGFIFGDYMAALFAYKTAK